ncbi:MAG TPA: LacI family DNA-binding transcriptional regulator [Bryobacteraceae bacterium]|nr:LacI family DNA-binding transcriptional regulator [Bryobacteraceae bacterium]
MGVNIKDVAKRAGVSIATVSHVLNGTRGTRPQTKRTVLAAVDELGYSRNLAARDLVRGRSSLLALIISDIRNPFFPEVTAAFQDQALTADMEVLVVNTNYEAQRTLSSIKRLIGLQVPGFAVLTSQIEPSVIDMLTRQKIAAVYLDLGSVGKYISNIVIDYEHGVAEALEHLSALGHRKIGYIGGPLNLPSARRRKQAFLETATRLGVEPQGMIDSDFTVAGGYFACSKLLKSSSVTAIMAGNDLTAIGVLHRAYDGGMAVPSDLSVVGFDDILFSKFTQPALTTVALPRMEIGRVAFRALSMMLASPDRDGQEFRVGTQLVVRQSTAAAPGGSR